MEEETASEPIGSRFKARTLVFFLLFLLLVGFLVIWFSRTSIADNFVRAELDKLDIEASYEIADIGFNKQVIRNLVLGDPDRPDLTAELVEIGNSLTMQGAGINWVRAKNVKLFGTLKDGKISFGELDKFSDPDDTSPLALPDIWLGIAKGQLRIDSDYGAVGMAINGEGNLQDGFDGELAAISETLTVGDCVLASPSYFGTIGIANKRPSLKGPLRVPAANCPGMSASAEDMAAQINVTLGEDFVSWEGDVGLIGGPVKYAAYSAQELKTSFDLTGDMIGSDGQVDLTLSGLQSPYGGANILRTSGPFKLQYGEEVFAATFSGKPTVRSARLDNGLLRQITAMAGTADGTPVGPLAEKAARAAALAGRDIDINADMDFRTGAAGTSLTFASLDAKSRSGALMSLSDTLAMTFAEGNIRMTTDGALRVQGGGLPSARLVLNDGSLASGFSGRLEMASYQAGGADLRIPDFRFSPARGGGTNIDGRLLLSGPLADGQITGLQLPINGSIGKSGNFTLFRQCVNVQFASLKLSSLTAGPTQTRLCPAGQSGIVSSSRQGVNIAANAPSLRLNGAVGGTPLSLSTGALVFSLNRGIQAQNVAVRLGTGEDESRLDASTISAIFGSNITGKIGGANGKVANVPLLMENIDADWRYVDGAFLADANLLVRDEQQVERFRPLISKDVSLKFADGEIAANGNLLEPTTQKNVANVDIVHALDQATGRALLNVSELKFDDKFQPELLTPLTLGVIANLQGVISGTGEINWDSVRDGIQSEGKFRSDSLNLAAAFGPVTGLSGEINFVDLLTLETAPGQSVMMAEVNPGVAVFNGILNYQLLPDFKMQIEGGRWPFAGGFLLLEPTILDLGDEAERRLVFSVEGVDAAQFLTQFDFENMSASGVFDGKLPMVFDQDGGRIVGGYLAAREGGGSVSYIGELTYEDMGTFANFAFNALKSVKYRNLTIGMEGAIDGEIVTEVKFSGLQQGDTASKNFITKQLAKIPIEFNVRIQAPFMQLMSSAKAYYEPEILVGQNLPALLRAQEARATEAAKKLEQIDE